MNVLHDVPIVTTGLKYEKPIYVTFRPETFPPNFFIYRAGEPPGEGEI
jgi:hypothetical protein